MNSLEHVRTQRKVEPARRSHTDPLLLYILSDGDDSADDGARRNDHESGNERGRTRGEGRGQHKASAPGGQNGGQNLSGKDEGGVPELVGGEGGADRMGKEVATHTGKMEKLLREGTPDPGGTHGYVSFTEHKTIPNIASQALSSGEQQGARSHTNLCQKTDRQTLRAS